MDATGEPNEASPFVDENQRDADQTSPLLNQGIGGTPRRWIVLLSFSFLSGLNSLMWITFAPVRAGSIAYYGVSGDAIDWLSMIYMAMYPFVFAPASWYIETGSVALQRGLRASAALNVIGAFIRYLSAIHGNFSLLFVGQCIVSSAQAFTLGAPPQISGLWFEEHEWGLATGIGVLANQVGPCVAYYLCPAMVNDTTGEGMSSLLLTEFICLALTAVMIWCAVPEKPSRPPSMVASTRLEGQKPISFGEYCAKLIEIQKNYDFLALCVGYCFCVGTLYAFETLLDELIPDQSIGQQSLIGVIMLFMATPGAVAGGFLLDITGMYKGVTVALTVGSAICIAVVASMSTNDQTGSTLVWLVSVCAILGFLLGAILTAGFEWGVELTFGPGISESTAAGVLNAWAQVGGVILIYGLEYALDVVDSFYGCAILVGALVIASVFYLCIFGELKRQALAKK